MRMTVVAAELFENAMVDALASRLRRWSLSSRMHSLTPRIGLAPIWLLVS